jgi:hypothetical protein
MEMTSDWNYDVSCVLTSFPVSDLEIFMCLIFVAQSVHPSFQLLIFSDCGISQNKKVSISVLLYGTVLSMKVQGLKRRIFASYAGNFVW